jgi:hypothetical protein
MFFVQLYSLMHQACNACQRPALKTGMKRTSLLSKCVWGCDVKDESVVLGRPSSSHHVARYGSFMCTDKPCSDWATPARDLEGVTLYVYGLHQMINDTATTITAMPGNGKNALWLPDYHRHGLFLPWP